MLKQEATDKIFLVNILKRFYIYINKRIYIKSMNLFSSIDLQGLNARFVSALFRCS